MKRKSFFLHLLLFVFIELLFVIAVFHEFPHIELYSLIGIGHLVYWTVLILSGVIRLRVKKVWQRFLASYTPQVAHLLLHLWIGYETIHSHAGEDHDELSLWLIVSLIGVGVIMYRGEVLLHRKYHCEMHHHKAHKHCIEEHHEDCEKKHHH